MKQSTNEQSDFELSASPDNRTEFFVKLPNRLHKEKWFKNITKRAVLIELCLRANWHDTFVEFKNKRCVLQKGECLINQREIASELGISVATINRVLKFLTEIQEIETRKTNTFTFISITYLTVKSGNETPVKHQRNTRNVKYELLKDVIKGLDNIDKIDNNINEKQVFVEDNNLNFNMEEETDMTKINASVQKEYQPLDGISVQNKKEDIISEDILNNKSVQNKKEANSYIKDLHDIFADEFLKSRRTLYTDFSKKNEVGVRGILNKLKKIQPTLNNAEMKVFFREFIAKVMKISYETDKYIYTHMYPAYINGTSGWTPIIILLEKSKHSFSSVGQATGKGNYNLPLQ